MNRIVELLRKFIGYDSETNSIPTANMIKFIIDIVLVVILIILVVTYLLKNSKNKKHFVERLLLLIGYLVVLGLAYVANLQLFTRALILGLIIILAVFIVNYAPELKNFNKKKNVKTEKKYIENDQKDELINTLLQTVSYLTQRKIGAIITIERDDSLDSIINNGATKLESLVSLELLATIFFPNTALHDGGVIIRGNLIMCAAAFYPSSDKPDIEKHYGSRHRAALGISERTDAFTIVCSEETGKVSYTLRGTIKTLESIDELRDLLRVNIIVDTERNKHE